MPIYAPVTPDTLVFPDTVVYPDGLLVLTAPPVRLTRLDSTLRNTLMDVPVRITSVTPA